MRTRRKQQKWKRKIRHIYSNTNLNIFHLSWHANIIFIGIILSIISLFLSWIEVISRNTTATINGLHTNIGYSGYIILICCGISLFFLFPSEIKEKLKKQYSLMSKDEAIILSAGIIILLVTITSHSTFLWIQRMMWDASIQIVTGYNGVILSFIGALFVIVGSVLQHSYKQKEILYKVHMQNRHNEKDFAEYQKIIEKHKDEKTNMSLPI